LRRANRPSDWSSTISKAEESQFVAWLALSPKAGAVCQQGCDNNGNTFLGDDALLNTTANFNTANGAFALLNNTTGSRNIANGANALGRVVGAGCAAKQEATNTILESTVARQQREIQALTASLKEQASQIQKVSDKVEMSGAAPQMVANNQ
jgi:hypothetical protein